MIRRERVSLRQWTDADLARFAVISAAWGHGYPTEGAVLALRHGFDEAKLARIGLTRRGEFDHPRLPPGHRSHRHVLYAKERP